MGINTYMQIMKTVSKSEKFYTFGLQSYDVPQKIANIVSKGLKDFYGIYRNQEA